MSNNIITGIDIGTVSIKAISAIKNIESSDFEILAKTHRPTSGVKKGIITNTEEVSKVISECIKDMELQTNRKIEGVYANINGSHISLTSSRGLVSVSRADQKVSSEDIERVIQAAKTFPLSRNKEIIDVFPKEFMIDGVGGIRDPLDMQGIRFEAEVLILEGFSQYLKNTTQSILETGLQVNDLIPGILSAAESVLDAEEKERGVVIIDIGSSTTAMAVFEEEVLLHTTIFPIGSRDITNDIAIGLKIDIDTAENIKLEFGSCIPVKGDKKKEKIVSLRSKETVIFSKMFLRKIIDARVCEMFDLINDELKKIAKNELLPSGVVITGGGSLLFGISDLVKKQLKLPCRRGVPLKFSPPVDDPRFAVACGLVMTGYEIEGEYSPNSLNKVTEKVKRFFKSLMP